MCMSLFPCVPPSSLLLLPPLSLPPSQVLVRHLPTLDLLSSLSSLLTRPRLPTSPRSWQDTAVSALQILTSPPLAKQAPDHIDDIIITSLPLLLVHRHGNTLAGKVANILSESEVGATHPLLRGLKELQEDEGTAYMYLQLVKPPTCTCIT